MTHGDILLAELGQRARITLRELLATYGERGYTERGFAMAAFRLRREGKISQVRYRGEYLRPSICPCCKREQ